MSYTTLISFDFGSLTGLTLNAKLFNAVGVQVGPTITTGVVELGYGKYSYLATIPDGHVGTFFGYDSSDPTINAIAPINPQETENADVKTSTVGGGGGPTAQQIRDAMKLAPTAGAAAADSIDDKIDTLSAAGGFNGSRQVTLNFKDADGDPVADVVFSVEGVGATATDGTGIITVGLNDGTYTVLGSPTSGTMFEPTEIEVDASHTEFDIEGTSSIPALPGGPGKTTGVLLSLDENGDPEAGIVYTNRMVNGGGVAGFSYPTTPATETSDVAGTVNFINLIPGANYTIKRGDDGEEVSYTAGAAPSFSINEVMGADES